jgi:anhydro-N-acetylmuramic acid kinase
MSGTSCDGLTVTAVQLQPFAVVCFENYAYPSALQKRLLHACKLTAPQLSALHFELGKLYAHKTQLFLKKHKISTGKILCIGMPGQTVYHGPNDPVPNTLQLAEPSFLAEQTGCPVVSHFRGRDMVLGGQGAPLMPFFDEYIFGKNTPKILLNLGGISNLSVVGKNIKTYGFDCGPANTLMDLVCQEKLHCAFDKNGTYAAKGTANSKLVSCLLKQKFFRQKPPKSLDKNQFGPAYLKKYFSAFGPSRTNDLLATLNYFTAAAVAQAVKKFIPHSQQQEIIVSGGGAFNQTLLKNLETLTGLPVVTSNKYHIPPQAKEAAAFALFAACAIEKKSNHCPRATGAHKKTILGQITL